MDEPLKVLQELGDELERVARRDVARGRRRRRGLGRGRPRSILALAAVTMLVLAAVAVAAGGLLTGEPLENPRGVTFSPHAGLGMPVAGSAKLLGLRTADPGGGPPWGLRTLTTTRGYGCAQLGRIVDGRLGVLGQDGAFADDGKFHEKPPEVLAYSDCLRPDAAGHLFLAVSYQGMPVAGLDGGCTARPEPAIVQQLREKAGHARRAAPPICPAADERIMYYGLLGPQGKSITYADEQGRHVTVAAAGPEGAYLVVLRPKPGSVPRGGFYASATPMSGLISVRYRDGSVCRIRSPRALGGAKPCPAKGFVNPPATKVTAADVRTPVHAVAGPAKRGWRVTLSFHARVAGDAGSQYVVSLDGSHLRGCRAGSMFGPISRDLRAGQTVSQTLYLPKGCHGSARAAVAFQQQKGPSGPGPVAPGGGLPVGATEVAIG